MWSTGVLGGGGEKCTGGGTCVQKGVSAGKVWWRLHVFVTLGLFDSNTPCNNIPLVIADGLCITTT